MPTRREFVNRIAAGALLGGVATLAGADPGGDAGARTGATAAAGARGTGDSTAPRPLRRAIPASGETLPVIGLGTSDTFDVEPAGAAAGEVGAVYDAFARAGLTVLDSSPMYGRAQAVLGVLLAARGDRAQRFVATKVWTRGRAAGERQIADSMRALGVERLDLLQIHNLLDWREHVPTLRALHERGALRYTGITHYTVGSHAELLATLRAERFDFVQLNYSIATRAAEDALLPWCQEHGVAVLVNRPFEDGRLFAAVRGVELPPWAADFDCTSWAQFFLKFVVSHPAVTCAIPATSNVRHQQDNVRAAFGRLPDARERERMAAHLATLGARGA